MTLWLALLAGLAQPAATASVPFTGQGQLAAGAPETDYGAPYGSHALRLTGGTRYRITTTTERSGGYPTRVEIRRPGARAPLTESQGMSPFAWEDGGREERFDFLAPESGSYELRVIGLGGSAAGPYAVRVEALAPLPTARALPTPPPQAGAWQVFTGRIELSDAMGTAEYYDDYPVRMRPGELWIATVEPVPGTPPDPNGLSNFKLAIYSADSPQGFALADADARMGAEPVISYAPSRAGTYLIRVADTRFEEHSPRYRLRITHMQSALAAPAPTP